MSSQDHLNSNFSISPFHTALNLFPSSSLIDYRAKKQKVSREMMKAEENYERFSLVVYI